MTNDPETWGEPIKTVHRDGRTVILRTGMWFTVGSWNKYRNALCINAPGYPPYPHDEQPTRWMDIPKGPDPRDAVVAAARSYIEAWDDPRIVWNSALPERRDALREALKAIGT